MRVTIEIPMGTNTKYEIKRGVVTLDRVIKLKYPTNYGYANHTSAPDGDALDVFVVAPALVPGTQVEVEIVGGVHVTDNGVQDDKLIAVPVGYKVGIGEATGRIVKFLKSYKPGVVVGTVISRLAATKLYNASKHDMFDRAISVSVDALP